MPRGYTGRDVFDESIDRMVKLFEEGHRVVVSFSGGKDSTVLMEICLIAAKLTNRLPLEVIMRDDEIMFPGTFEYAARVAARPEVDFHWIYACQPVVNMCNRKEPFFWAFDPLLEPDQWVRKPPDIAYRIDELSIDQMTMPSRFPVEEGKTLFAAMGLRVSESRGRLYGIYRSKGHVTKPNKHGTRNVRPIYDWTDSDVWKAISENRWDYNQAYDLMLRLGVKKSELRIAPPTQNINGVAQLSVGERAWPRWFSRVCKRLPGVRSGAKYGKRAVTPQRRINESWEDCFHRTCIETAPEWIAERALDIKRRVLHGHRAHSASSLPEIKPCYTCTGNIASWKRLAFCMYGGDPFCHKTTAQLRAVEPEFFRSGSGKWGGSPGF